MKNLLTVIIIAAMTISLFGCEGNLPPEETALVTEGTSSVSEATTVPETTVGTIPSETTAMPELSFVPDERLKLLFADEDFKEEFSEYIHYSSKWIKVCGNYLISGYFGPLCDDCSVFNICTGKKLGTYEGNNFDVYDDNGTKMYIASDFLYGTGGGHDRIWEIILNEDSFEKRSLFYIETVKDYNGKYNSTYYVGDKEVAEAEYDAEYEKFFSGLTEIDTEKNYLPWTRSERDNTEKGVHDDILERLGEKVSEPLESLIADGAALSVYKSGDVYDFVCSADGKTV